MLVHTFPSPPECSAVCEAALFLGAICFPRVNKGSCAGNFVLSVVMLTGGGAIKNGA